MGKKCYVLLCPPLQTAPPTGEAAKLASDVAQITSYKRERKREREREREREESRVARKTTVSSTDSILTQYSHLY
jgi:hypothetical protein